MGRPASGTPTRRPRPRCSIGIVATSRSVEFSSDSAACSSARTYGHEVKVWDARTFERLWGCCRRIMAHCRPTAAFHRDDIWCRTRVLGCLVARAPVHPDGAPPRSCPSSRPYSFPADSPWRCRARPSTIVVCDALGRRVQRSAGARGNNAELLALASGPGGVLVAGDAGGNIYVWDTSSWGLRRVVHDHADRVTSLAFSPDGRWLATGSSDTTVHIWPSDLSSDPMVFKADAGFIHAVAFTADSQTLAVGTVDGLLRAVERSRAPRGHGARRPSFHRVVDCVLAGRAHAGHRRRRSDHAALASADVRGSPPHSPATRFSSRNAASISR